MAFLPQTPSDGPVWLPRFASSIADLFRRVLPGPLKLFSSATADLPPAADYLGGIVHDSTADTLKIALGAGWSSFSLSTHVHAASAVTFAPAGSLAAVNVQAAIEELDTEKAALAHTHAIADVTGLQAALDAKLDDTQASAFGLTLLDDADAATAQATLGLVIGTNVQAYDADLTTWAGITPAAGIGTFLATPSSANLLAAVTDETGTGSLVFSISPTFTGTITAAAATFSGSLTANGGVITGSIYIQGASPEAALKDTDTAGNSATMFFAGRDSANAVQWRVGRPFTTVLRFENLGGSFGWYNALGAGQMMLLDATGLDVVGLVRCDSFRIDVAPTAAAVAQTHHVPININGVTYKLLLAS